MHLLWHTDCNVILNYRDIKLLKHYRYECIVISYTSQILFVISHIFILIYLKIKFHILDLPLTRHHPYSIGKKLIDTPCNHLEHYKIE
jgi:hypothetical protein